MKRRHKVFIWTVVGFMTFSAVALSLLVVLSPSADSVDDAPEDDVTQSETSSEVIDFDELGVEDTTIGDGEVLKLGDTITVNYSLTLPDGTPISGNNTFESGQPATFPLTVGGLIDGWTTGLPGMQVGGTRRLEVPSSLGYGAGGQGPEIPGGSGLIFVVELLEIVTE